MTFAIVIALVFIFIGFMVLLEPTSPPEPTLTGGSQRKRSIVPHIPEFPKIPTIQLDPDLNEVIEHFYEGSSQYYSGHPIAVDDKLAALVKKRLGYVLSVKKTKSYDDRPYLISLKKGKKFKAADVLPVVLEERDYYRNESNKLYHGMKELLDE